ncbi:MAG TPA: BatA domain-containing protein [Gemmatimonadaceae bacterium]|nr:BatA domain-containing protein [Gemmatimonadaceae bacterium]
MTWLAPSLLLLGLVGALGVVAAHLLARHRPRRAVLPTARFVPSARPVAATRLSRPADRALLALRALAVLLVAAAFARPALLPRAGSVARVVLLDRSSHVADSAAARALATRALREPDRLVAFDTGSLSAGLAAAMRAGAALRHQADSIELVVVSPATPPEIDAATARLRAAWPGRIRHLRVPAPRGDTTPPRATIRAAERDVLRATLAVAGLLADDATATRRIARTAPSSGDSAWVRGAAGRVLVVWPAGDAPAGWRRVIDTVRAAASRGEVLVAPFARTLVPPDGAVAARWVDGQPMATERPLGAGCIRYVALDLPSAGDLALRPATQRMVLALLAPCLRAGEDAMRVAPTPAPVDWLAGDAGAPLASARALARRAPSRGASSPLVPWLLAGGALLLLVELAVRGRARGEVAA